MTDRAIASRPSLEQVMAIVDFMEKHPALALGQLRGLEGRDESKKLWFRLTRIVNNINGPTRPMKSWIKYWADKKSTVRSKVQSIGDSNTLCSNIEKRIYDLFLATDSGTRKKNSVKQEVEMPFMEDSFFKEDSPEREAVEVEPTLTFNEAAMDAEERQMAIMDKLLKVTGEQASAMTQLAHASLANAQAMERLADASHVQARALERLAGSLEAIGAASHDVRNAIVDIDATMKRFYSASPS